MSGFDLDDNQLKESLVNAITRARIDKIRRDMQNNLTNSGLQDQDLSFFQSQVQNVLNQITITSSAGTRIKEDTEIIVEHLLKFFKQNVVIEGSSLVVSTNPPHLKSKSSAYNP